MYAVTDKTILCKGRFLQFVKATYVDRKGMTREWEFIERVACNGIVAIVPVTDKNEILLIRQFRPPVNRHVIEFPAGLNDKGDTIEEAARRELLEETGYYARHLTFLAEGPLSSGASGEILTVYLARDLEFVGITDRDETEDIEVIARPLANLAEHLDALRSRGDFVDLKILGLAEKAKAILNY